MATPCVIGHVTWVEHGTVAAGCDEASTARVPMPLSTVVCQACASDMLLPATAYRYRLMMAAGWPQDGPRTS